MKILFVFPHFLTPGGAANAAILLAQELSKNNIECHFLCAKAPDEIKKKYPEINITTLNIPASNSLFYWFLLPIWQLKINQKLKNYKDFLLFPQVFPANWWVWIYKKFYPKSQKVLWWCQEPSAFIHSTKWINSLRPFYVRLLARTLRPILSYIDIFLEKSNDYVFCNSEFTALNYKKIYNKPCTKVLYPSISISTKTKNAAKEKVFFTISHLSAFKNIDNLINAFANIAQSFPDYKLIIAGEGEAKKDLLRLAASKNLKEQIYFTGKISNTERSRLYRTSKATVLCSENEPFGLVPVESMSYGTPVIAHNSGGPSETISHTKDGFLYNNLTELKEYLIKLIQLPDSKYKTISEQAIKKSQRFSTKKICTDFINTVNHLK